ncbi:MAG: hypothetical protein M3R26_06985 [Actinomycetota bacterium]|nr:hypothetical protein [Actinomycetota bacterium]MDQ2982048.1 hypothetical protein [Actinomycetota bacterium]
MPPILASSALRGCDPGNGTLHVIDGRMFLHYFRTTPDGRVLMGSGSGSIGLSDRRSMQDGPTAARAEQGLRHLLPELAAARITHS